LFPKRVATYDPADPVDAHVLMPEYLTCEDKSEQVARHVIEWLSDPAARTARVAQLAKLRDRVGHGGASSRAADYMVNVLNARKGPALRTHFDFDTRLEEAARGAA
jgi:lipid-A-disaccharide synthase